MVKLSQSSSVSLIYPQAREWDELFRKNYSLYQRQIDKLTYSLQRKQRYFLSLSFPKYYQPDVERLEVLKNIQELGAVKQQELDAYKNVEPSIDRHYNIVFGTRSYLMPNLWQILGVGVLIGSALIKKPLWSVSSFLILAPMAFRFTSYNNLHKTNEFLDFTIKVRAQKCILERLAVDNGDVLPEKKDKKNKK